MKKSAKILAAGALSVCLLAGAGYAMAPEDSLVSLSYLTEKFMPFAQKKGEEAGGGKLQQSYDNGKKNLDAVQSQLRQESNGGKGDLHASSSLVPMNWSDGALVELPIGSSFLMGEGAAVVSHNGAVIDVTTGKEVPNGARLQKQHRYLVGEGTKAVVEIMSGAATMGVQGTHFDTPGKENPMPFYDVSRLDWYYAPVSFVYEKGIFSGTGPNTFEPLVVMDRAQIITAFYKLAGSPKNELAAASNIHFTDVPEDAWYAPYVKWAAAQNVTGGVGDGKFGPSVKIDREQFVQLLYNFAKSYLGKNLQGEGDLNAFSDGHTVSDWARTSVSWAVAHGIMESVEKDEMVLKPQGAADRAAASVMLMTFTKEIL